MLRGATPFVASAVALSGAYIAYHMLRKRQRSNDEKPVAIVFGPAAKFAGDIAKRLKTEWEVVVASVRSSARLKSSSTMYHSPSTHARIPLTQTDVEAVLNAKRATAFVGGLALANSLLCRLG
jgi:hypothetical protein